MDLQDDELYKAKLLAQPYGGRRAQSNWGRVDTFIQFLSLNIFDLVTGSFVDRVLPLGIDWGGAKYGFWAFKKMCLLLGFPTSGTKDQPPCINMHLLGAELFLVH